MYIVVLCVVDWIDGMNPNDFCFFFYAKIAAGYKSVSSCLQRLLLLLTIYLSFSRLYFLCLPIDFVFGFPPLFFFFFFFRSVYNNKSTPTVGLVSLRFGTPFVSKGIEGEVVGCLSLLLRDGFSSSNDCNTTDLSIIVYRLLW